MLAAEPTATQQQIAMVLDAGVQLVGWLCVVVIASLWWRRGWRRDPLAGVQLTDRPFNIEMMLVHVATPVVAYVLVRSLLATVMLGGVDPEAFKTPGSDAWHRLGLLDSISKLVGVAVMIAVLHVAPCFGGRRQRLRVGGTLAVGVVGALAVTAIGLAQLAGTNALWRWMGRPDAIHPVFTALTKSDWGDWGVASLVFSAVVVAPLAEELFFRGILLQVAWRATESAWLAVLVSALAFGAIHLSVPPSVLPLCTFGIVLGYVRLRYRSLAACVLIHMLFNARPIVLLLVAPEAA